MLQQMLMLYLLLQLYQKEAGRNWTRNPSDSNLKFDAAGLRDVFLELASQETHRKLSDFDDHLNDITRSELAVCHNVRPVDMAGRAWHHAIAQL